jgi:dGTPase
MKRLDWTKLITTERFNSATYTIDTDARTEFERDIDRIIFSTPFRRLKDKTQVFPVPKSDFVHNRLTHSIEVSSIGRSLGKLVGRYILDNENVKDAFNKKATITCDDFADIIASACLAHDIGNPPFGHSGEQSFRLFFKGFFKREDTPFSALDEEFKNDFLFFEGNAEGLRLLTNDHPSGKKGGLKLTYTTLAVFTKYPRESIVKNLNNLGKKIEKRRSFKKVGFFQKEKEIFQEVAEKLELISLSDSNKYWARHPLSFIVEAADNITYTIMDLEDGHKLKLISTDEVIELLKPIAMGSQNDPCNIDDLDKIENNDERVGAYRAKVMSVLIYSCFEAYKNNFEKIMTATYDHELTEDIKLNNEFKRVSDRTQKFFSYEKVIEIESGGRHVIGGLLQLYIDAYLNMDEKYGKNLINSLPSQFKVDDKTDLYDVLLNISCFISRMTDNYAIDHYRKLCGHKLPEIL